MNVYIYCSMLSAAFLAIIIYYIKTRKLELQYCIFWIALIVLFFLLSINKNIVEYVSKLIGVYYAPAFLFVTGIVVCLVLIFYSMIIISDMKKRIVKLTQEISILKNKLEDKNV